MDGFDGCGWLELRVCDDMDLERTWQCDCANSIGSGTMQISRKQSRISGLASLCVCIRAKRFINSIQMWSASIAVATWQQKQEQQKQQQHERHRTRKLLICRWRMCGAVARLSCSCFRLCFAFYRSSCEMDTWILSLLSFCINPGWPMHVSAIL